VTARVNTSGRGWAYTGAVLGGLVSIAANVAHSFIPPKGQPANWAPEPGAVVGAIVWPVFLFIAVEILARVAWPKGRTWRILRFGGLLPVAVVAAFVSYRHLSGLLAHYGEEPIVTWLGPLAVDGLMVMATGALLATGRHHATTPVSAPAARPAVPAGPAPTPQPSPVDTQPTQPAQPTRPAPTPAVVPTPAEVAARITTPRPSGQTAPAAAPDRIARRTGTRPSSPATPARRLAASSTDFSVTAQDAAQLSLPNVSPQLLAKATTVAGQYRAEHGEPITAGQLAVRLKVTSEQATRLLEAVNTNPTPTVNGHRPAKAAR
jgi:outer membrane biosynthesis protein TonB